MSRSVVRPHHRPRPLILPPGLESWLTNTRPVIPPWEGGFCVVSLVPALEGRRSADLQSAPEHRQSLQQGSGLEPNKGTGLPGRTASPRSRAIKQHNPAGWETRHYEPMKPVNNSSETASPRGGVWSIVKRTQSTATQVNTIRLPTWTSLRVKGEVLEASARQALGKETEGPCHGGPSDALGVVGGSRLGKGSACEDGRPGRTDRWQQRRPGVRAAIVARKPGNAGGAKGGRKTNGLKP